MPPDQTRWARSQNKVSACLSLHIFAKIVGAGSQPFTHAQARARTALGTSLLLLQCHAGHWGHNSGTCGKGFVLQVEVCQLVPLADGAQGQRPSASRLF